MTRGAKKEGEGDSSVDERGAAQRTGVSPTFAHRRRCSRTHTQARRFAHPIITNQQNTHPDLHSSTTSIARSVMLVGLGGNNGTTVAAGILANKQ